MFPLYDESQYSRKIPSVTILLIVVNITIFLFSLPKLDFFIGKFGLIPERFFAGASLFTPFTSMFFHGGFLHILGNMWFLGVFGPNLERRIGHWRFLLFYILCGLIAALFYLFFNQQSTLPVIGASGAISGVLGGYLVVFPNHKIRTLLPIFIFIDIISVPAIFFIGFWFLYQLLYVGAGTMVAYVAHIGGFVAGMFLIKFFLRPGHYYDSL